MENVATTNQVKTVRKTAGTEQFDSMREVPSWLKISIQSLHGDAGLSLGFTDTRLDQANQIPRPASLDSNSTTKTPFSNSRNGGVGLESRPLRPIFAEQPPVFQNTTIGISTSPSIPIRAL